MSRRALHTGPRPAALPPGAARPALPTHPVVALQRAAGNRAAGEAVRALGDDPARAAAATPATAAAAPCRDCGAAGSGVLRRRS